jgi:hypothetical protein
MAKLAGIVTADKNSPFDSGAAFLLSQKCKVDDIVRLNSGWEVEVHQGSPYVVARITGAINANEAFSFSHNAVQEGLDFLSITGKADLSVRDVSDECLLWWRETSNQILRVVTNSNLSMAVGTPSFTVTDQHGNLVSQPPIPSLVYHESLRYFRLSQVTEDLFDAFRNMYLAFELLLEHIVPKKHKEQEKVWLRRALTTIDGTVPLNRVYITTEPNLVDDIYKNIYVDIRCAIFHAKNTPRLLPQNLSDRQLVNEGLHKLTKIVLLLAENWLQARRLSGVVTYAGFDHMTQNIISNSIVIVSDNDAPLSDSETMSSPSFQNSISMNTRPAPELSKPGLNTVLGSIDAFKLHSLQKIARLGLVHQDNLMIGATVEAKLTYNAIDRLEAQIGILLKNVNEPKYFFKT